MKKILFSAVSALAVCSAIAADSTNFAVMKVPSSEAETIVSVPWLMSTTTNANVRVADLVLTAGLNEGDELMYYNTQYARYDCWILNDEGQWVSETSVSSDTVSKAAAAQDAGIPRGGALILKRGAPIANCFYIMGKPADAEAKVLLRAGAYTLVAPPSVTDTDVNTNMLWEGVSYEGTPSGKIEGAKDSLIVSDGNGGNVVYTWKNSSHQWMKKVVDDYNKWSWTTNGVTIPAGRGAWFHNGGTSHKAVQWPKN